MVWLKPVQEKPCGAHGSIYQSISFVECFQPIVEGLKSEKHTFETGQQDSYLDHQNQILSGGLHVDAEYLQDTG